MLNFVPKKKIIASSFRPKNIHWRGDLRRVFSFKQRDFVNRSPSVRVRHRNPSSKGERRWKKPIVVLFCRRLYRSVLKVGRSIVGVPSSSVPCGRSSHRVSFASNDFISVMRVDRSHQWMISIWNHFLKTTRSWSNCPLQNFCPSHIFSWSEFFKSFSKYNPLY